MDTASTVRSMLQIGSYISATANPGVRAIFKRLAQIQIRCVASQREIRYTSCLLI